MKNLLRKITSIVLALAVLFSISNVFAVGKQIKVRIEGLNDTLYDRYVTVTDEVYGIDLLYSAIGENNVEGTSFITGLLGEQAVYPDPYWSLYNVNNDNIELTDVGISGLKVSDIDDELLYHVTEASWPSNTVVGDVVISNEGNDYTVTVTDGAYTVENANVNISYLDNLPTEINGQTKSFTLLDDGIYDVDISKDGTYPELVRRHYTIEVGDAVQTIKDNVNDLIEYYNNAGEYDFREAMALNAVTDTKEDLNNIHLKYQPRDTSSATNCAASILGLTAAGYDPQNYNGTNYVGVLKGSQDEEGKFIIGQWDDYATTQAYSILALDMAGAEYNESKAIDALLGYQTDDRSFGDVDSTSMCIMALAKHKDIAKVETAINNALFYLEEKQLETGGFESGGEWSTGGENPYSTITVIQALVANNINPLSQRWAQNSNGNTMLDALLSYKEGNYFKYESSYGTDISSITQQTFTALADLYNGRSIYHEIRKTVLEADQDFNFERVGTDSFNLGQEAKIELSVKNNTSNEQTATVIVALYNTDNNSMEYYNYFEKDFDPGENEEIASGMLLPDSGNYEIRAFLWDNTDDMNVLADSIVICVE